MGATQTTSKSHKAAHYLHTYTLFAQIRSHHSVMFKERKRSNFPIKEIVIEHALSTENVGTLHGLFH